MAKHETYPNIEVEEKQPTANENNVFSIAFCCSICKKLPIDLVESKCCNSLYCWECFIGLTKCIECAKEVTPEDCKPNFPLKRIINSVEVTCSFSECKAKMTNEMRKFHEISCEYRPVVCPNSDLCGILIARDLPDHVANQCENREILCPKKCGEVVCCKDVENHLSTECVLVEVPCSKGCGARMRRLQLSHHIADLCLMKEVSCEFAIHGCSVKPSRQDYPIHMQQEVCHHVELLSKRVKSQDFQIAQLQKDLDNLNTKERDSVLQQFSSASLNSMIWVANAIKNPTLSVAGGVHNVVSRTSRIVSNTILQYSILDFIVMVTMWVLMNLLPLSVKIVLAVITTAVILFTYPKVSLSCTLVALSTAFSIIHPVKILIGCIALMKVIIK